MIAAEAWNWTPFSRVLTNDLGCERDLFIQIRWPVMPVTSTFVAPGTQHSKHEVWRCRWFVMILVLVNVDRIICIPMRRNNYINFLLLMMILFLNDSQWHDGNIHETNVWNYLFRLLNYFHRVKKKPSETKLILKNEN